MIQIMDDPSRNIQIIRKMVRKIAPLWLDQESLAQDIWLECWKRGRTPSWVNTRHRVIDTIRKEKLRRCLPVDPNIPDQTKPNEFKEKAWDLIDKAELSPNEKLVLYRHYYQDETLQQIASMTETSLSSVQLLHVSSLRKLREANQK